MAQTGHSGSKPQQITAFQKMPDNSDVSGRSGSDMAGSVENTGLADFPVKKSASVDYYLTTILKKQTTAERC